MSEIDDIENYRIEEIKKCNTIFEWGEKVINDYSVEYYNGGNDKRLDFITTIMNKYYELKDKYVLSKIKDRE